MKNKIFLLAISLIFATGCATGSKPSKLVVWETTDIQRPHQVLGPVSVSEQVVEGTEDMIQGIAGFITKDGRVSDQVPSDMKAALDVKREKYKEMIFEKLGQKAKEYGADAVIGAEYAYIPPYVTFSRKATVTAKGTMIEYRR
jgi:uncharacterized protein YbjQ (UPF0145 family)